MTAAAETSERSPRSAERIDLPVEVITAVVLSVATLLTSWSGYQAALWDGDQSAAYTEASSLRTAAARASTRAGQVEGVDLLLFSQWLDAYASKDEPLQAFYRSRFRAEFQPAMEAWLALEPTKNPAAPKTPFAMPQYGPAARAEAQRLERAADAAFRRGQRSNQISDAFIAATVILASAMFFGGICQVFRWEPVRLVLAAVSVVSCIWGLGKVMSLPVN